MQEKSLLKTAIICALAGISLLFVLCNEITVEESMLNRITDTDSDISVKGSVVKVTNFTNSRIVQIEKKEKLDVVVVGQDYLEIGKGDTVEIIGSWSDKVQGNLSILAKEIRKV